MKKKEDLTPNETWLLSVLYELGDADIFEILDHVVEEKDWKYTSVESFLNKLHDKGYLIRRKCGRRYRYSPAYSLSDTLRQVLDKLFRGFLKNKPVPFVDYLFQPGKISERDRKILLDLITAFQEDNENDAK